MKCAVVECHQPRGQGTIAVAVESAEVIADLEPNPFCAEHLIEFLGSLEAKQPKRATADFVERRWKESAITASLARGNKPEPEKARAQGEGKATVGTSGQPTVVDGDELVELPSGGWAPRREIEQLRQADRKRWEADPKKEHQR